MNKLHSINYKKNYVLLVQNTNICIRTGVNWKVFNFKVTTIKMDST